MRGFEPPTSSSRTKRATGLRYIPNIFLRKQPLSGCKYTSKFYLVKKKTRIFLIIFSAYNNEKPGCAGWHIFLIFEDLIIA